MKKLDEENYQKIRKTILKKLYSVRAFHKGHLLLGTLQSGLPSHLVGFVKNVLHNLIKKGFVGYYGKTKHGLAYQLNIKKLREIEEIIFS